MSKPIDITQLANGALVEDVHNALQQVYDNIADPNTKADGVREVVLKLKFKPGKDRNYTGLTFAVTTKLQPVEPQEVPVFIDRVGKDNRGFELAGPDEDPQRHRLPGVDAANVTQLRGTAAQ